MIDSPTIVVAGASGYIGRAILPKLLEKFPRAKIIALSRSQQQSPDPRISWKSCDLFSLKSIEEAMPPRVDLALYLVHSMGPTAALDQGTFADYDLLLADNFSRALSKTGISQLIYLGGLIPEGQKLSLHLQSRLEVEECFAQYKIPITVFRAGLILGEAGSSFQILLKLVQRLPLMLCPKWTQTLTTPVDLQSVLNSISDAALESQHLNRVYDLAGCQPLTYVEMMRETARKINRKRYFITVPFFTPTLSRLWVCLVTNTSKDLVYPLIESLKHPMVARESHRFPSNHLKKSYFELLEDANFKTHSSYSFFKFRAQRKTVRSVQRLPLPKGCDAEWVKDRYLSWLRTFMAPIILVRSSGTLTTFSLFGRGLTLLELNLNLERSHADRQLLYITGGRLVSPNNRGRLEFRVVLNRQYVLAAIHDYQPALPWFVYKYSQALLHTLVMKSFGKYLKKVLPAPISDSKA